MDSGLAGKAVIVTGGSRGIGRAIAKAYIAEGARVAVSYNVNREAAEEIGAELAFQLDLELPDAVGPAIAQAIEQLGGLDVLVLNAVRQPNAFDDLFEDQPQEEIDAQIRANLTSPFAALRAALPAIRKSDSGRIVFISSGIGEEGFPRFWAYATVKAALVGLVRTLAWDVGRYGVLVNAVAPGATATEMSLQRIGDEGLADIGKLTPQQRVSTPEDVARVVLFLGSAANTSVTGELVRDGTSASRTPLVVMNTDALQE